MQLLHRPLNMTKSCHSGFDPESRFKLLDTGIRRCDGFVSVIIVMLGILLLVVPARAQEAPVLKSPKDKLSYSIGVQTAKTFAKDEVEIDMDLVIRGLKDGFAGGKLLMPEKDIRQAMRTVQAEVRRKMVLNHRVAIIENKKKGDAFLAANKGKEGVITLPSGVQYKILKAGSGKQPTDADIAVCDFRGTLLDGTEFDSTEPGKPTNMKISTLMPGWKEAMKLMPTGSTWQIFVPSQLAYGERGVGSDIGPNEMLIFEVELLSIK
jgi:FKBP-type peptidyl-prolyl cis-trans isomerase